MEVIYTTTEAARDTLALIRYKTEGNDEKFKETALTISRKLDLEGRCDAALFIRAQYNEIPTFIPMNDGYVRPSKDAYYLGIAKAVAQRATCLRRIYGAVIVNNDEIVSTGYNGAPRGQMIERCVAVHAEENAIISASRREMNGATLYLWGMDVETGKELPNPEPCLQCWRRIRNAGIVRVVTVGGDAHAPQSACRD